MFPAVSAPEKLSLCGLSRGDLEALTERLLAENAALKQANAELRAEIAALKGVKGRPVIRPSGMEQKTEPKPAGGNRGRKRRKTEHLVIHEERIIRADMPATTAPGLQATSEAVQPLARLARGHPARDPA